MRFLHLEDNPQDAELVAALLAREWPQVRIEVMTNRPDFEQALALSPPDLILSDFSLPAFDGLSALDIAHERRPEVPFIFLSGTIGEETAVEALKNGATDYLLKDRMGRLIPAIQRALTLSEEHVRRRQAEAALQESRELSRQIAENVADLIAVLDLDGRRTYVNPACQTVIGGPVSLLGTKWFHNIHPEDRERIQRDFRATILTGAGRRNEYRLLLRDGTIRFIESQSNVMRDATGRVAHVLIVGRDVTERRRAEEQIREQASLLDKARDAICVAGLDHTITYWNASASELFGWAPAEAVGSSFAKLLSLHDPARYEAAVSRLIVEENWQGELQCSSKEGRELTVDSRWTLVKDAVGKPRSILFINTDITERKKLEVQFLRTQRLESIGTLAGGIAHDLNNVLTPVLIAAEMLRAQIQDENGKELAESIATSALHGAALIKQVLLFARGAEGEHTALQLQQLIGDLGRLLRETLPRSIVVRTGVVPDLRLIRGDATQLNQVMMNLCVNARDAMPGGGSISITAKNVTLPEGFSRTHKEAAAGPYVKVSVEDTGTGIAPEFIDRIFDPFFTTKEIGKGTGLGLSTAIGIVKSHGGVMHVSSEPGKGTRFDLYLPAIPAEDAGKMPDSRAPLLRGRGEGVLVIDDETYVRDVVGSTLNYCGYRTFLAAGGEAGAELYQKHQDEISLALVDMMMTGLDGIATMRCLRKINPQLPLLAMSGMLDGDLLTDREGFEDVAFLSKPFTAQALLNMIGEILKVSSTSAG